MRTPEQGHQAACLAAAMIAAIENMRDATISDAAMSAFGGGLRVIDHEHTVSTFRGWAQQNGPLHDAEANLRDGLSFCICK